MANSWWILGAGYTGGRLAARLVARGDSVVATHRTLAGRGVSSGAGAGEASASAEAGEVAGAPGGAAPGSFRELALELDATLPALAVADAYVVCCAPPGDPPGEREARLVAALHGCRRLIYVSSTGVYAPGAGQWVDEAWPIAPEGALGQARAVAEARLIAAAEAAGLPWTILRAAGIHGPGRGLVARVQRGEARVIGDGSAHVSRIHVDDLGSAILAAAERDVGGIINCADDEPAPHAVVLDGVARMLGLPPPPRVAADAVSASARAMLLADRKIANRRLHEDLGVTLRYPSWRDAVRAELAR